MYLTYRVILYFTYGLLMRVTNLRESEPRHEDSERLDGADVRLDRLAVVVGLPLARGGLRVGNGHQEALQVEQQRHLVEEARAVAAALHRVHVEQQHHVLVTDHVEGHLDVR
eukprot:6200369-Pleurochrysis_carterae.AAC.1